MDFCTADKLFKEDRIKELYKNKNGLRFLKLRSLSRRDKLKELAKEASIDIENIPTKDLLKLLFESNITEKNIERFIRKKFKEERSSRKKIENKLINELYKLKMFDWGGLHQNSLEKTIVDNYVKKIQVYKKLCEAIDDQLQTSLRGYVLCSWYNHWTSIIIEDIFKEHRAVLPAVGLVKKIDFFINNRPFDLKVTHLPEGYVKEFRQLNKLKPELTLLKQVSRELKISFTSKLSEGKLLEDLWQKLDDHPSKEAQTLLIQLKKDRDKIINLMMHNPYDLLKWYYENQGTRRFDASNRLFLVIIDKRNYHDSWQLKRAKPLLVKNINSFLNRSNKNIGNKIKFRWEGKEYNAIADVIFVIKE